MKKLILYIIAPVMLLSLVACDGFTGSSSSDGDFVSKQEELGAYSASAAYYQYDADKMQLGKRTYSNGNYEFKIQKDDQRNYVIVRLDGSAPSTEGSNVGVTLTAKAVQGLDSGAFTAEVIKIQNGKAWLWNEEKEIGLIINI